MGRRRTMRSVRAMTLLEILVSLAVLAMISLLIYGAFDSMSRGRRAEAMRVDRARQGRQALERITREISGAYVSAHNPYNQALLTRRTAFIAQNGSNFDRVDFASFAHVRVNAGAKESDQAEIAYFVVPDPDVPAKKDLVRREQSPIDLDPLRGGVINVIAEDVEEFDIRYFDPIASTWVETWDTRQLTQQLNRLPLEVKITLVLKGVGRSKPYRFVTKVMLGIQQPLSFGVPR